MDTIQARGILDEVEWNSSMNWFSRLSLKSKFLAVTFLLFSIVCVALFLFTEQIFRAYMQAEMQDQAREIAVNVQGNLESFMHADQAREFTDRLLTERREISRLIIFHRVNNSMELFVESDAVKLPENQDVYKASVPTDRPFRMQFEHRGIEYWEFVFPILQNRTSRGLIAVTMNFSQYKSFVSAIRTGMLMILAIALAAAWILMNAYFERTIRNPLAEIVRAMEQVKRSQLGVRLKPRSGDEIGLLATDFNNMTSSLQKAQQQIIQQNQLLEQKVQEAVMELRARNLELYEAQDELRRSSRLATAGQIAASIAHELGSPLSSISGHVQLMLEDRSRSEEDQERLNLILGQVERLSETIRSFLNSAAPSRGEFRPSDINNILHHVIDLMKPVLQEKRIQTVLENGSSLPPVFADASQMQQLFLNLFSNAVDAMRDGGVLTVKTEAVSANDPRVAGLIKNNNGASAPQIMITVADTGVGIPPAHIKDLFRPFFSTKDLGSGTGLGLSIVKELIKKHSGQILVESEEGKGTIFRIILPAMKQQVQEQIKL
ncbi:MAG TPA: ATP-binding protein [Acidobacteriota bacterium]|nr:ATP-binding protein [Acidobacteriota bacterium]